MYLRFVSPLRTDVRGVNLGIFQSARECSDDEDTPAFYRQAIQEEFDWFNENLPHPGQSSFEIRSRRRMISYGICWFRGDAREMIAHAFNLRALMAECGMIVTTIGSDNPGQILYADSYQIVARPRPTTPTAWG